MERIQVNVADLEIEKNHNSDHIAKLAIHD